MNTESIFTKIVRGEIPSYKIDENDEFMAILDIFPSHYVQILIISKMEVSSKFTDLDAEFVAKGVKFAHKIAKKAEKAFPDFDRFQLVIEGFEVNHFHIKIYPAKSRDQAVTKNWETSKADDEDLKEILEKLKSSE